MAAPPVGVITGTLGELRFGHQVAVRFESWNVSVAQVVINRIDVGGSGRVESFNEFYSTQRPLDFWAWMGDAWWVWRDVTVAGEVGRKKDLSLATRGVPEARR